jgi:hypothetical protein
MPAISYSMENRARLKSLIVSLIAFLGFVQFELIGQPSVIDSLQVETKITAFSKNRSGDIFLAFEGGGITKYNGSLDSIISFSPSKIGDITLIEAGLGFQIFTFYNEFQEFAILDRFLTRDTRYDLSQTSANYIDNCTFSRDQNLWAFEENQMRLVKINLSIREVIVEVPLEFIIDSQDHKISFIKEYQNLVFIVDELSGIYIFDNLGNYLRKIEVQGVRQCSFNNDNLFFIAENELHILSLYNVGGQLIKLPEDPYLGVLATPENLYLILPKEVRSIMHPEP